MFWYENVFSMLKQASRMTRKTHISSAVGTTLSLIIWSRRRFNASDKLFGKHRSSMSNGSIPVVTSVCHANTTQKVLKVSYIFFLVLVDGHKSASVDLPVTQFADSATVGCLSRAFVSDSSRFALLAPSSSSA